LLFERILSAVSRAPTRRVAVAVAEGHSLLEGMVAARERGIAEPVFFGDAARLRSQAETLGLALDPRELVDHPDPQRALSGAVGAVRRGECDVLLKGQVPTPDFLRAVLGRHTGLRGTGLLCHMAVFELDAVDRPLFLTDSGLIPHPSLAQKREILRQGIAFLHRLGIPRPRVAILASSEHPDPGIPASMDAQALVLEATGDTLGAADVAGPYALDLAVSPRAASLKGVAHPVAGRADLLLCPDVVAGNLLGKSMILLGGARAAGVLLGARAPVVMLSRADDADTKLRSLALAIAAAGALLA
jgi:phosphate butyryltransferase